MRPKRKGTVVRRRGMSGTPSVPDRRIMVPVAFGGIPFQAGAIGSGSLKGSSLDGSSLDQPHAVTTQEFQTELLSLNRRQAEAAQEWVDQDRQLRYMQMAVTAAIPLFAVAWKWLLGWHKSRSQVL